MNEKIFENESETVASFEKVENTLMDLNNLLKWVPDVTVVDGVGNDEYKYIVRRHDNAFNDYEEITIKNEDSNIIYISQKGNIEYNLIFNIHNDGGKTRIKQALYITNQGKIKLPLKILSPIAKKAFKSNLNNLVKLVEFTRN
ncbi:hypothetical protein [Weissella kandleri]|nr:hypothetical protein [Weissella kandleri]